MHYPKSCTRRRSFCSKRRPYNNHNNLNFIPFFTLIEHQQSISSVARSSNIRRRTLSRHYHKWKNAGRPPVYTVNEKRGNTLIHSFILLFYFIFVAGTHTVLTNNEQTHLSEMISEMIDKGEIVQNKHVRKLATFIYDSSHPFELRRYTNTQTHPHTYTYTHTHTHTLIDFNCSIYVFL